MRIILPHFPFACWLFLCLLPGARATAQFRLSSGGAMAALNGNIVTTAPPVAPLNNMTTLPTPPALATTPVNGPIGQIVYQPTLPNDRSLSFVYQSALAWWSGYLNYKEAAQSLNFNGGSFFDINKAIGAANFIMTDGVFTQFQSYSPRRATMIMRANDQSPVHFPMVQDINNATVQLNMYTPVVSPYSFEIPLSF